MQYSADILRYNTYFTYTLIQFSLYFYIKLLILCSHTMIAQSYTFIHQGIDICQLLFATTCLGVLQHTFYYTVCTLTMMAYFFFITDYIIYYKPNFFQITFVNLFLNFYQQLLVYF